MAFSLYFRNVTTSSATRNAKGPTAENTNIESWTFERNVISVGCIEHADLALTQPDDMPVADFNAYVAQYEAISEFCWPRDWDSLVRMICATRLHQVLTAL